MYHLLNNTFEEIILTQEDFESNQFNVVGEFIDVLGEWYVLVIEMYFLNNIPSPQHNA